MDNDLVITVIYFTIIIVGAIFFVLYYYVSERKEIEIRVIERINQQKAIETLVNNVANQFHTLTRLPYHRSQFRRQELVQALSWLLFFVLIASFATVISLGFIDQNQSAFFARLKIGAFVYVLFLNLYFIMRQYVYYANQAYQQSHNTRFQALRYTNFNYFEFSLSNYMQLVVLLLEFFQLLYFPVQDILLAMSIQGNNHLSGAVSSAENAFSIASLLPNISVKFYFIQFWTITGLVLFAVIISLALHFYNDKFIPGISLFWLSNLVPVVHVAYLPILVTFINSVACLLSESDPDFEKRPNRILKCRPDAIPTHLYLIFSLIGFTLAYVLLTIFVTSYERKPLEGDIEFKSKGVAFIKNMSLLLTICFSLIPAGQFKVKGILSVIILTSVVVYSLQSRPCYVSQVNFWRTVGYCCILWSVLPGAILNLADIRPLFIILLIVIGWVTIILLSLAGRYCAYTNLTIPPTLSPTVDPLTPNVIPTNFASFTTASQLHRHIVS